MPEQKFSVSYWESNPDDLRWMGVALDQARLAEEAGEVPVGAAIVLDNVLLASAHNSPVSRKDACAHAELLAVQQACASVSNYRLGSAATLYVTLQPCLMCLGAILHARIGRVVIGCGESRFNSSLEDTLHLFQDSNAWAACRFETGCGAESSRHLLGSFFRARRRQREQGVANLATLMHLPNANKGTIAELARLGIHSPSNLLETGLENVVQLLQAHADMLLQQKNFQQAAIFSSLVDYFSGEAVQSWKNYLQG
ncbi:MAG TPA: nucleoside deaminase [Limnobacter sp.]|nr:nucleoside deaminase [Limnobacter sp.]